MEYQLVVYHMVGPFKAVGWNPVEILGKIHQVSCVDTIVQVTYIIRMSNNLYVLVQVSHETVRVVDCQGS